MEKTKFNPKDHLEDIKGRPYLPVAWRLVWFREEHPDWSIETELKVSDNKSIAKATIKDETGRIIATAHKTEDIKGFYDYVEKSETGSVGRALALCGFGTQFSPEIEEGPVRIVDSPVVIQEEKPFEKTASDTIRKMYFAVAKRAGFEGEKAKLLAKEAYKVASFNDLTHNQLQKLITKLGSKIKTKESTQEALENVTNGDLDA